MRVLQVCDFYPPYLGGVEHHVAELAHGLSRRGHEVAVATLVGPTAPSGTVMDGPVTVHRLKGSIHRAAGLFADANRPWAPPLPDPELTLALLRLIREWNPNIIHGHDWLARSALPVVPRSIPLVTTLHYYSRSCAKKNLLRNGMACPGPSVRRCVPCSTNHYGAAKGVGVLVANRVGAAWERRRSAATIAVSSACAAGNDRDSARIHVIPNSRIEGIPAEGVPGLPTTDFILFVGDIRAEKGLPVLLEAHARLHQPPPLVVIGAGLAPPTNGSVIFLGERPHDQVLAAFERCLFSVVPSIWSEPFGLVALEAMTAGSAVVASSVGGLTDIVVDRRNGLLFQPGDVAQLAAAMQLLLENRPLRHRLEEGAAKTAQEFSPARMLSEVEHLYRSLSE